MENNVFKNGKRVKNTKLQIVIKNGMIYNRLSYRTRAKINALEVKALYTDDNAKILEEVEELKAKTARTFTTSLVPQAKAESILLKNSVSEIGNVYLWESSARIASTALKKVWERSGNGYIYRLWRESVRYFGNVSISNYENDSFKKEILLKMKVAKRNGIRPHSVLTKTDWERIRKIVINSKKNEHERIRFYLVSDEQKKEVFKNDIMRLKNLSHGNETELVNHGYCYINVGIEYNHDNYINSQLTETYKFYHDAKAKVEKARELLAFEEEKNLFKKLMLIKVKFHDVIFDEEWEKIRYYRKHALTQKEKDLISQYDNNYTIMNYYFHKAKEENVLLYPDIRMKKKRISSIWKESKLSELGKEMEVYKNSCEDSVIDLQLVAYRALAELVSCGLIREYNDIVKYHDYAYSCVNAEINANRKIAKEVEEAEKDNYISSFESESAEINVKTVERNFFTDSFKTVETTSIFKSIYKALLFALEKRANRDTKTIAKAYIMYVYFNMTQEAIAKAFNLSQRVISKYIDTCNKLFNSTHWGLNFLYRAGIISALTLEKLESEVFKNEILEKIREAKADGLKPYNVLEKYEWKQIRIIAKYARKAI